MLKEKIEEICPDWKNFKYICFYRTAFPFMKDSWGVDYSDSKEELLKNQWSLFSIAEVRNQVMSGDQTFEILLSVLATDPQLIICSDGEYRIMQCSSSPWHWICVPAKFNKHLWKKLSSLYRMYRRRKHKLFRDNLLCLDDDQFRLAQRLIRDVFDDEILEIEDEKELSCKSH